MLNRLKPKSEFSRNVLTLMTGTTIAQAIPIAISPILTRIYTPEDFGVFALYMSIASMVAVVATGRYELAIMLPKKDEDAIQLVILSILIAVCISLITFLIVFILNKEITNMLGNPKISNWLYFVPLTVLLTGIYQSLNYWNNRNKEYKNLAISRVADTSTNATVNLLGIFFKIGASGLILGSIIGKIVGIFSLQRSRNITTPVLYRKLKMIALARKYKKFPLINSLHTFINILKNNLVTIYISIKYTSSILGFYYFVLRIMQLPSSILGGSLAQVFYKQASVIYNNKKDIQIQVKHLIGTLALLAIIPAIILFFYSEELFVFVFGEDWITSGKYAKAIIPYIFFHFIASPLGMVPLITNLQDQAFYWGIAESILFVLSFVIGFYLFGDLYYTLFLLSIVFCIYFPIYFIWIYNISKGKK